jgi:restriction system protein
VQKLNVWQNRANKLNSLGGWGPVLDALRALGGKASPRECSDWIAEKFKLPAEVLDAKMKSGSARFHNQVQWARQYLAWEGMLDSAQRGIGTLTAKGAKTQLDEEASRAIFLKWVSIFAEARQKKAARRRAKKRRNFRGSRGTGGGRGAGTDDVLLSLPPDGFERLCKRLLHEYGLERLVVLGKSHDGGLDGRGVLRLNPFVGLKVMFNVSGFAAASAVPKSAISETRQWDVPTKESFSPPARSVPTPKRKPIAKACCLLNSLMGNVSSSFFRRSNLDSVKSRFSKSTTHSSISSDD